jgi:hypothetical protein
MGIDIYAEGDGMTDAQREAQITGCSVEHGHVGYLREAYHGEPYATNLRSGLAVRPSSSLRNSMTVPTRCDTHWQR